MTVAAWNIIGLLLSLAGVILLFRYGMPYRVRTEGVQILTIELTKESTEANRRAESRANLLGKVGLGFIVLGTGCQIAANYLTTQ